MARATWADAFKGHTPRKRGIQYAAACRFQRNCSGILDHPLSRMMTTGVEEALRVCLGTRPIPQGLQHARRVLASRRGDGPRTASLEVCHAQASRFRKPPLLSASRVSGGSHSPRKPTSSAVGVLSIATSNWPKSSVVTTCAHAALDAGFKACCMKSGAYDGSNRNDYF